MIEQRYSIGKTAPYCVTVRDRFVQDRDERLAKFVKRYSRPPREYELFLECKATERES